MMRTLPLFIAVLLTVMPWSYAHGAQDGALTYSRTNIIIMRASAVQDQQAAPAPPLPWQIDQTTPASSGLIFDVEIRDAVTYYSNQGGWFNLSGPTEKSGVMLMFSDPGIAPISPSAQYAPLDVLMIDKEGTITQIIPNLMMSELDQEILPQQPVRAFLFLKGGICESTGIQPGDYVLYKLFRRAPTVLSTPAAASSPAPQQQVMKPILSKPAEPGVGTLPPVAITSDEMPVSADKGMKEDIVDESLEPQPIKRRPPSALMVPVQ